MKEKEQEKRICSVCGADIAGDEVCEFDGKVMCRECFEGGTTTCDCCGIRIWSDDAQGDSGVTLCNRCYEYNYTTCDGCGRLISNDDAMYEDDSDYPYCESCYERIIKSAIKSYNYKPEPVFYGSGNLFIGVELKIDKGGEIVENAEKILRTADTSISLK